ncbi:hypothetical protein HGM15179_000168 [Zosterops borbonicus]|uniref:Uncharacterized protein n=1 Tax=Zosterops borbonicus TaxID=364589 RepID=A0A8K1LUU6_9PASS|nr:hypothetical protein HGM15179_000168 [Zosterops borbonicus]
MNTCKLQQIFQMPKLWKAQKEFSNIYLKDEVGKKKLLHHESQLLYRLAEEWLKSSPAERNVGMLVGSQLNMIQQCAQMARKANGILACIKNSAASRTRAGTVLMYSAPVGPHLQYHIQFGVHHYKKDTEVLEHVQGWATELVKGLEHKFCEGQMGLFSLEERRFAEELIPL